LKSIINFLSQQDEKMNGCFYGKYFEIDFEVLIIIGLSTGFLNYLYILSVLFFLKYANIPSLLK